MGDPARNVEDIARFQPESAPVEQKKPWERMKNEPARWFLRFQIYRNLGAKRSLRATIAAEAEAQPETKGDKRRQKTSAPKTSEKLSDVSVPGSWSRAAKVWQWKERAQAWDLDQLYQRGKRFQQAVGNCTFASRVSRIQYLNSLILTTDTNIRTLTALDQHVTLVKQQQSLLKQMADEMSVFDALDTTELDGRVAQYLSEKQETRNKKQAERKQTSARAELDRRLAGSQRLSDAEFEQLLAEGNNMLAALGERKH